MTIATFPIYQWRERTKSFHPEISYLLARLENGGGRRGVYMGRNVSVISNNNAFLFIMLLLNAMSKKVITRDDWEKRLKDVNIRKEDMNKLVMNFLVTEGYVEAAEKFRTESGTEPDIDLATITDRMAIKEAVQRGNVEDAIEKVNDLNPEILDTNPQLFFHLQQQRLIELIRNGKVEEALEFAQEELAPRGEENLGFLEELEKTVALLAFEDVASSPVGELLDVSQRLKTASEINAAILTSQSHEKDPKLPVLLKLLTWTQNQLGEKVAYPRINDVSTAVLEDPAV
nr:glucose-induced degradation protein 8 homolog [Ipomoea batatas]